MACSLEISGLYQYLEVSWTNFTLARVSGLLSGIEYLEKSGSVWEKETVLLPLGLAMPLATGEEDTFPLMVA